MSYLIIVLVATIFVVFVYRKHRMKSLELKILNQDNCEIFNRREGVRVSKVEMFRDGGSIEFTLSNSKQDGNYRLESPFFGTPRPLFKNGAKLNFSDIQEMTVLEELNSWLDAVVTDQIDQKLKLLEKEVGVNLSDTLKEIMPIFRIKTVVSELEIRLNTHDKSNT